MNILILGAAGGTGRELVRQALAAGHRVTAFARRPSRLGMTDAALLPFEGDLGDSDAVRRALGGQDAVISALGNPSPFRRNPGLVAAVASLVREMEAHGPARLVFLSSVLVPESRHQAGRLAATLVPILLSREIADHVEKEASIVDSSLDWTLVRPTKLSNGSLTGSYLSGPDVSAIRALAMLPRADLAECMLGLLEDERASRNKIVVVP